MGYMRHHAIIVTSGLPGEIESAHAEASKIFPWASPISPPATNGYRSFFIPPDGSKEFGGAASEAGDEQRAAFVLWLTAKRECEWVEVQYADDEGDTRALRCGRHPNGIDP